MSWNSCGAPWLRDVGGVEGLAETVGRVWVVGCSLSPDLRWAGHTLRYLNLVHIHCLALDHHWPSVSAPAFLQVWPYRLRDSSDGSHQSFVCTAADLNAVVADPK